MSVQRALSLCPTSRPPPNQHLLQATGRSINLLTTQPPYALYNVETAPGGTYDVLLLAGGAEGQRPGGDALQGPHEGRTRAAAHGAAAAAAEHGARAVLGSGAASAQGTAGPRARRSAAWASVAGGGGGGRSYFHANSYVRLAVVRCRG
jgi:hypothetical protein